jgi:hypothetical protein
MLSCDESQPKESVSRDHLGGGQCVDAKTSLWLLTASTRPHVTVPDPFTTVPDVNSARDTLVLRESLWKSKIIVPGDKPRDCCVNSVNSRGAWLVIPICLAACFWRCLG